MLLKSSIKGYKKHRICSAQPVSFAKEKIQRKRDTKSILLFSNPKIASKVGILSFLYPLIEDFNEKEGTLKASHTSLIFSKPSETKDTSTYPMLFVSLNRRF